MDELSRDLMRGEGGLQALNGAMDSNLTQWAQGEAVSQLADADQQPQPRMSYSPPRPRMSPRAFLGLLILIAVLLVIAFH
jgi:hypothetical protein